MPAQLDPGNATNFNLDSVTKFEATSQQTDGPEAGKETEWIFPDFTRDFGYYKDVPELRSPIGAWATWVLAKGWDTKLTQDKVTIENWIGWGEDSANSIFWNMLVMKKVAGDSFAQILRNDAGRVINLKPLSTGRMRIIAGPDGMLKRYDYMDAAKKEVIHSFQLREIFHLCNDRVADEIHGNSVIGPLKEIIDSMNEAQQDYRRLSHLSTVRILYADEQDSAELAKMETQYKKGVGPDGGNVVILPGSRKDYEFEDLKAPPVEAFTAWMRYLEDKFYRAIGFPKIGLGDAQGIPESGGIMSYVTYEPQFNRAITDLQDDCWNQLGMRITFEGPATLAPSVSNTQNKNIDQTQPAQPSDTQVQGSNQGAPSQ